MSEKRFSVVVWHGEGRTLFYVVDMWARGDEQPAVVSTWRTREEAQAVARCKNEQESVCPICRLRARMADAGQAVRQVRIIKPARSGPRWAAEISSLDCGATCERIDS